ncbi:MAG: porin [Proteobacteria bacterium]|nr:porin [Pseudomonadota bacterium]
MKKSFIALAVLGAFASGAQAQTNVTIGGVIQGDLKSYKVGGISGVNAAAGRQGNNELRVDDDYTSRFWLTGSEDLGGGNAAIFYIENRFSTDQRQSTGLADGAGLGDGNTYVGLKGAWGQFTVGKHTMMAGEGAATEYGITGVQALPSSSLATNTILNYVGNRTITNSRVVNSILYQTPKFSGFGAAFGYSPNAGANENTINNTNNYSEGSAYFLKGNYTNGPIYVNLAYWNNKTQGRPVTINANGSNADQTQFRLSGSYAFPFGLKVGLQYDRATLKDLGRTAVLAGVDRSRNAWEIPISYQFGANTILFSYTKANDFSDMANTGAKLWTLGYDYALSKRTNIGVFFSKLDNDYNGTAGAAGNATLAYSPYKAGTSQNGSALLTGESGTIFAVSLKHIF